MSYLSRIRMSLEDKKALVEKYKNEKFICFKHNLENPNGVFKDISIKQFCTNNKIRKDSMFSTWLRMDNLGQLESWGGQNNLKLLNFRPKDVDILKCINEGT